MTRLITSLLLLITMAATGFSHDTRKDTTVTRDDFKAFCAANVGWWTGEVASVIGETSVVGKKRTHRPTTGKVLSAKTAMPCPLQALVPNILPDPCAILTQRQRRFASQASAQKVSSISKPFIAMAKTGSVIHSRRHRMEHPVNFTR